MSMENYDGHTPKRQRTDGDNGGQRSTQGGGNFYNYNQRQGRNGGNGSNGGGGGGSDEDKVNHVLLMTVLNPQYPITVDVIHTICSSNGEVLRIVIFKKNGVQAMVEFDSVESAKRAKVALDGADIYSGCCTLRVEYAKPTRLNVYKNDHESYDYTNVTLSKTPDRPGPLLQEPRFGSGPTPFREGGGRGAPGMAGSFIGSDHGEPYDSYPNSGGRNSNYNNYGGQQDHYGSGPQERFGSHHDRSDGYDGRMDGPPSRGFQQHAGGGSTKNQQGAVMMVYAVNHEKINCDRMFNLFCLFGNVVRVKFLKSKEGCAMIQMGDGASVERAVRHLNNAVFFDCRMQLGYSKQAFLNDVQQPFELPDGTPSFKDFMGNRNNRFTNPEAAGKNRIQPPSKVLHFFNSPYGISEEDMKKVFENEGVTPPTSVKLFTSKTERSSSGLMEWESVSDALEALVICNHTPIQNPSGKFPYVLKLCFSSSNPRTM